MKEGMTSNINVLGRKAENQSYQATIQTDILDEPNSCKITKAGPPASKLSSLHLKKLNGVEGRTTSGRDGAKEKKKSDEKKKPEPRSFKMFQKTVVRNSFSSSTEFFKLRAKRELGRACAYHQQHF
jgi:hypothetical protein